MFHDVWMEKVEGTDFTSISDKSIRSLTETPSTLTVKAAV